MNKQLASLITVDKIIKLNNKLGYTTFYDKLRGINLNIGVVRADDKLAGTFNDIEFLMWEQYGKWNLKLFSITTDPSKETLLTLPNPNGAAIIVPGQHIKCWKLGYHKNKPDHPALVQVAPITVIRDFNKDGILDYSIVTDYDHMDTVETGKNTWIKNMYKLGKLVQRLEHGYFGINNHRASMYQILNWIGLYSQGCMVHNDYKNYMNTFIPILRESANSYGELFTITVYEENQLKIN